MPRLKTARTLHVQRARVSEQATTDCIMRTNKNSFHKYEQQLTPAIKNGFLTTI